MTERVVITGMGAVTPLGVGVDNFWRRLVAGETGIHRVTRFDPTGYKSQMGGEVPGFDPTDYMDKKEARRMDRFIQMAVAAGRMALEDAHLDIPKGERHRAGVILGTALAGVETLVEEAVKHHGEGGKISPFFVPGFIANMAAGQLSILLGLEGPNLTLVTACAAGTHSIGEAMRLIREGKADVMLAGGSEAAVVPLFFGALNTLGAASQRNDDPERASRPFDKERDGMVIGEGAAVLVLESERHARARGAHIYGRVAGYGQFGDGYHLTAPAPDGRGEIRSMQAALDDAGLAPSDIDYINAHATSTPAGDEVEARAIREVFGEAARKVAVSSTKGATGHLLGAAGAVEAVACLKALETGIIPPNINVEELEPGLGLDVVVNRARQASLRRVLSNSFGFGGQNATIILERADLPASGSGEER